MGNTKNRVSSGAPIFLAAINMRAGINLIGPLLPILKTYFNLNNFALSLLAAIPLICFSGSSLLMWAIGRLGTSERIIKWALTTLFMGLIARTFTGLPGLYVFSFVVGISIAVMNYEIPAWVKEHASSDTGFITGAYSTIMGLMGSLSIAISVPLAHLNKLSWRMAMLPWIFLAGGSAIFWHLRKNTSMKKQAPRIQPFWRTSIFRNPLAWALASYFGLQSFTYYATATWLPTILTTKGFTLSHGALMVSISGIIGSSVGLMAPHYIARFTDKRKILLWNSAIIAFGFAMMTLQSGTILFFWLLLTNIGMSINFPVALMLAGTKSRSPEATRNLSTMMQSIGYLIAAGGPTYVGTLYDFSKSWNWAILGVVLLCLVQMAVSFIVGKDSYVD